jgi:4-hydroxy-4-methyl-2-oxoglutarate aldolase
MGELTLRDKAVDYIRRNRVSTTEVADCLGKTGAIPDVTAVNRGHFRVGPVFWTYACEDSNWPVHEQIVDVQEGDVVIVEAFDCGERAIFGDLVSKYLLLYKQAQAVVVMGRLRDTARLMREDYSIWCRGYSPVGCFNSPLRTPLDSELVATRLAEYGGALAVCDDAGVVVVRKEQLTEEFLRSLEAIEEQEDIWYECIDRRKWSTYDTVCLKKYLEDAPIDTH